MAVKAACCGASEGTVVNSDSPGPRSGATLSAADGIGAAHREQLTHAAVADYYGRVLQSSRDLKTSACTAGGKPPELLRQVRVLVHRLRRCGASCAHARAFTGSAFSKSGQAVCPVFTHPAVDNILLALPDGQLV